MPAAQSIHLLVELGREGFQVGPQFLCDERFQDFRKRIFRPRILISRSLVDQSNNSNIRKTAHENVAGLNNVVIALRNLPVLLKSCISEFEVHLAYLREQSSVIPDRTSTVCGQIKYGF